MWKDFKRNIVECKPIADHFFPYSMVGGLLAMAPKPFGYGLLGATACVAAYRFDVVCEQERVRVFNQKMNENLIEEQKETIATLSQEVIRLSYEIERIRKIKVYVH